MHKNKTNSELILQCVTILKSYHLSKTSNDLTSDDRMILEDSFKIQEVREAIAGLNIHQWNIIIMQLTRQQNARQDIAKAEIRLRTLEEILICKAKKM